MTGLPGSVGDRVELNPDVPIPPFALSLRLPTSWSRLDSNPQTWRRSADDLIDRDFGGARLPAGQRRGVLAVVEGLVADCQRAGAALSLLTVGRRAAGGAASFGLHLAFASDGRPASLGRVQDILPRVGATSELPTCSGPAVVHQDRVTMVVPGTAEIVVLSSIQVFLPIPGTTWTVVLSTASAYPELTAGLAGMVRAIAESISTANDDGEDAPDDGDPVERWVPTRRNGDTSGFERGFGTLVTRQLTPGPPGVERVKSPGRRSPLGAPGNPDVSERQ